MKELKTQYELCTQIQELNTQVQDMKMAEGDRLGLSRNNGTDDDPKCKISRAAEIFAPSSLPIHDQAYHGICANFESFLNYDHAKTDIQRASDLLVSISACADVHKMKIIDLAVAASEELRLMALEREPLWLFDIDKGSEVLNVSEYRRRFVSLDPTLEEIIRVITEAEPSDLPNLNEKIECCSSENVCMSSYRTTNVDSEASRAIGVVFSNPVGLVNMFMDVDKWSATFSNIVSNAKILEVLSTGNQENPNGTLQVMVAEFHVPSPLVKTREIYFVRCSRQIDIDTWVVADVSLETIFPSPAVTCQRKPSGCVIQVLQDGLSTVTWVEHNAESNSVVNYMFRGILKSGFAFSAKRWVSSLERECDRIATLEAENESLNYMLTNNEGFGAARTGLLKLAQRMVRQFNSNICSNVESVWRPLPVPGAEEILIKTSFNLDDPQIPRGVTVTVATSVWLPVKQNDVFSFLHSGYNRNKWDVLSHGLEIQDVIRMSSARNSTDCISVISVEGSSNRREITYLQESFSDSTAFYIVYAPVDVPAMHHILQGGCADSVAILPSGFAVLPEGSPDDDAATQNTILTIGFQIMDEQLTTPEELPPQSVLTAYRLMKETVSRIWTALLPKSGNALGVITIK
ncbi:homeobox-leucine zipper protein PROTODERMAL FACTOR 2-like isoform X2 [Sesamum indicum]|uniref:Homeobox-leucine zipper protein PROTODERMAL FACTOR 2-like isoform X2 n=1 Tax=Sesamum indicum TaxID=4182 RepID=A0A8M8V4F4_SESIN|nr:homeobox-leucine zipper protein PROTODERMAL FACTOR 2-like isoform X2 [Sesamum indicum]